MSSGDVTEDDPDEVEPAEDDPEEVEPGRVKDRAALPKISVLYISISISTYMFIVLCVELMKFGCVYMWLYVCLCKPSV